MSSLAPNSLLKGKEYTYCIEKVLGQGTFGITYLATTNVKIGGALGEIETTIRVAVKEFFMRDINGRENGNVTTGSRSGLYDDYKKKFIREAGNLSRMKYPGIVKVIECFEANNTVYYSMEYLDGGSLDSLIERRGGLSEDESIAYAQKIGAALDYMHSRKVLHLDLKPSNIMLRNSGEAVLIDFGLSKQYDANGQPESSTSVGSGTPGYAPLEQANYQEGKDFPVTMDVYALGATLFKMLTGVRAPKASAILNDGFPIYALQQRGISEGTISAVATAMQPIKKARPQSIGEFLKILDGGGANADETTIFPDEPVRPQPAPRPAPEPTAQPDSSPLKKMLLPIIIVAAALFTFLLWPKGSSAPEEVIEVIESSAPVATSQPTAAPAKVEPVAQTPAPVKEETPAPAQLYVTTSPAGATVYVDGKKAGTSPIEGKEYAQGNHTIKITLDGHKTISTKVNFGEKPVILNKTLAKVEETPAPAKQTAATRGTINGHEWVDLGLSVKWATCNVGASSPSDYGNYYAWGETRPKARYTKENCKTYEKNIGDIAGNAAYDAARANWGGSWRMPTKAEFNELINNCTWQWTTQGGKNGYKVTSKKNGNSIFFPAASWRYLSVLNDAGYNGSYWSSSPDESNTQRAYYLGFNSDNHYLLWEDRCYGCSVRPVTE